MANAVFSCFLIFSPLCYHELTLTAAQTRRSVHSGAQLKYTGQLCAEGLRKSLILRTGNRQHTYKGCEDKYSSDIMSFYSKHIHDNNTATGICVVFFCLLV